MNRQPYYLALLLWLLAAAAPHAFAQNAQLTGRVADQQGGAVVGATVTATNVGTKIQTTVVANNEGLYVIPLLPPAITKSRSRPPASDRSSVRASSWMCSRWRAWI